MLDEAHERTVDMDVLFGICKKAVELRRREQKELKLIVTSDTLDAEKFSKFYNDCPIFTNSGRKFPVEVLYAKDMDEDYFQISKVVHGWKKFKKYTKLKNQKTHFYLEELLATTKTENSKQETKKHLSKMILFSSPLEKYYRNKEKNFSEFQF